jgi:CheY-like chemotaxis protein
MPTSTQTDVQSMARVLVIDNREQVRRDLKRGLEGRGYTVAVAEGDGSRLHRNALQIAGRFRPHVAIVDLRLDDDHDTSDTTGLELLRDLRQRCEGLGLIVYSAYLTPTVDREINKLAAEWVEKSDEPRLLKETVDRLAAQSCAGSRSFTVAWPKEWRRSDTMLRVFDADIPASLLDDVIAQLFERGRRVWIHHVENIETSSAAPVSRGRSLVVKVQQQGNAEKIVKVSTPTAACLASFTRGWKRAAPSGTWALRSTLSWGMMVRRACAPCATSTLPSTM